MKDIHRCKNYLGVTTSIGLDNNFISDKVKDKLIKFSEFLVAFSTQDNESAPLIEYRKDFNKLSKLWRMQRFIYIIEQIGTC